MSAIRTASCVMSVVLSFLMALPASAGLVTDTWSDPDGDILLDLDDEPTPGVGTSYEYHHDITDDGFPIGDTITSATLYVTVRDAGGAETYQYEIGFEPEQPGIFKNVPNDDRTDEMLLGAYLGDLQDGIIDVVIRITADSNNQEGLYFVSSTLVAQVDSAGVAPAQVPEPWTLALMAFGLLIGGSFSARRGRS